MYEENLSAIPKIIVYFIKLSEYVKTFCPTYISNNAGFLHCYMTNAAPEGCVMGLSSKKMAVKLHELRNKFAVDLYQAISKSSAQNIIISPAGLQIILTILLHGARGVTAAEIIQVLHFPEYKRFFVDYKRLIPDLEKHLFRIATQIFIKKTHPISSDFQNFVKKHFSCELHQVDFRNQAGSVYQINDWSKKRINQDKGVLSFVSSTFLKPRLNHKFKNSETITMPFYVKSDAIVNAEMIILREKRFCNMKSRKLDAQIIELPFAESKLSMIIILPKKLDGLRDIESKLGSVDISEELSELWLSKVDLFLPKFKLEQTTDMCDVLSKIGMPTAFTNKANFSGISTSEPLTINHVIHKALVEVQDTGIEASEEIELNSYDRAPLNVLVEVKCDHPFLFIVLAQNEVLFVGRLQNPNEM